MGRFWGLGGIGCGAVGLVVAALLVGFFLGSRGTDAPDSALEQQGAPEEVAAGNAQRPLSQPGPGPQSGPGPLEFSGTGSQATQPFQLSAGLTSFEMTHQGEGYFIVHLVGEDGKVVDLVANQAGPTDGSQAAIQVPEEGTYRLNVNADGPWTVRVK